MVKNVFESGDSACFFLCAWCSHWSLPSFVENLRAFFFFVGVWGTCSMEFHLFISLIFSLAAGLVLFVGLSTEELERLAKLGSKAQKTARRDIAHVVSNYEN